MKVQSAIAASLVVLLGASRSPNTRSIEPEQLTGNISLSLKNAVWWFAEKDKPVYQTLILSLMCDRGQCRPTVWGAAPRFTGESDHPGTITAIERDNALHLQVKTTIVSPRSPRKEEANYDIEVIPYKGGWIGSYWGNFNGKKLQNKVKGSVSPLPELLTDGKARPLPLSSESLIPPERYSLSNYRVSRDLPYRTASDRVLTLDLYQRKNEKLSPVLLAIHGGGWQSYGKSSFQFLEPYLAMGFSVVDIEYRPTGTALAPAAVEDASCALGWVLQNARKYHFDPDRIVLTGHSAGGHLALTTGMIPPDSRSKQQCPNIQIEKVAAIVNWIGPSDIVDLIGGRNRLKYAVAWIGDRSDREMIARQVSPINYVRKGLPPIFSVYSDRDTLVPYEQGVRFHQALTKVGVPNELMTVREKDHGDFSREENRQIYTSIENFLRGYDLLEKPK